MSLEALKRIVLGLGDGSTVWGIVLLLLSIVGIINACWAFMLWLEQFFKILENSKSTFRFWVPIIVTTFGFYALLKLILLLPI